MKYKILFFVFFLIVLVYLYISHLNDVNVRLFVFGHDKYYENTVSDFVAISFVSGVIFAFILGFFFDVKRLLGGWREERKEKKREEFREALEKAKGYDLKGDRDKAVESVQRLMRRYPDMEEAYTHLAGIYVSMKEFEKALEVLNLAEASLGKKESLLFRKARIFLAKNDAGQAEKLLGEVLKLNELNMEALTILRDLLVRGKNWQEAYDLEKKLRRFIKTDEERTRFLGIQFERIKASYARHDEVTYPALMKDLKDIISEDKFFVPAYVLLAELYQRVGKPNEAARVCGRGYSKTGHMIFLLKMEDLYIERRDPGVILKIYRRILDVSPKNPLVSFLYARLCLRLEMIDEAIETLNALLAEGETFAGLYRALAEAYAHRGETTKSIEAFSKAFPLKRAYIPFTCDRCQAVHDEWSEFCNNCASWNTITVKKEEPLLAESAELKAIYEREALGDTGQTEGMEGT
jgi:uncharacterized protein HemY